MAVINLSNRSGLIAICPPLAKRLKELNESGNLERQAYNEIPPKVEYRLTDKGQELVESVIYLLNWMKKWA